MDRRRRLTAAAVLVVSLLMTAGCAGIDGSGAAEIPPPAARGEVRGVGIVVEHDGDGPVLCLQSGLDPDAPPSCEGVPVSGWAWPESAAPHDDGDLEWGAYAVVGEWDGTTLTVTDDAIPLALYDPPPTSDPLLDPGNAGVSTPADVDAARAKLEQLPGFLGVRVENGYVFARVVYDDGSLQVWCEENIGPGAVIVSGALRDVR